MQLNELIETEGLEGISEKTNISIYNLNSLVTEDFNELNRVRALGFVHILKREYGLDTEALESSIKNYFEINTPSDNEPALISIDKSDSDSGFSKWIIILILLGGLLYLYNTGKLHQLLNNDSTKSGNDLNDTEALKSKNNISEDDVKKRITIKKDENKTKVEINTSIALLDRNKSKGDKIKIIADIPQEKNSTLEEDNKTVTVNIEAGIEEPVPNTPTPDVNATEIKNFTINPTRGMLWYGLINLTTKKRKEYMQKDSKAFDMKDSRWILTTGHGYLDIVSDMKTVEVADKRRHFFYIDKKEIKEITRKDFKRLNHGRMW